jgi:transcriptional regulator with XRE-family HTH domain
MKQFSGLLHQFMERDDLNQSNLARACGKSPSAFNRIIHGETLPAPDTLESILSLFPLVGDQRALVEALLRDYLGTTASAALASSPDGSLRSRLSVETNLTPKGRTALQWLLETRRTIPQVEDVFVDLALAMGWNPDDGLKYPMPEEGIIIPPSRIAAAVLNEPPDFPI